MYLFDTDTYSNLLRGNRSIERRFSQAPAGSVYLCAITPEEMLRGRLDAINQARSKGEMGLPITYDYLINLVRELNRVSILRYDNDAARIFSNFPASVKRAGSQDCRFPGLPYCRHCPSQQLHRRHFQHCAFRKNRRGL